METKKYYEIKNIYLAQAMAFFNFKYYKFNTDDGKIAYTFEDTDEFRSMMYKLTDMKKEILNKNN